VGLNVCRLPAGMDSGTNVVLLGGDAEMAEAGPAPAPAPGPERSGSEAAEDEAASSFPWAKPDALAALSGPAAAGGGVPRVDAAPEVADEGAAPEERGAGGAAERPRLPPELARAPPGPVDPDVLVRPAALQGCPRRQVCRLEPGLAGARPPPRWYEDGRSA